MYEAYFGFSQRPFAAAPLANRYFPAASVDAARQTLARCIERGAGAGLLIGPPGMGKSLLLQVLAAQFADKMAVVQLAGGQLEVRRELLQAVLFELHLPYRGLEEGEMRLALVDHLTRGDKCPQGMLLVVDEAQTLPRLLLEELRMMTNLARGGETRVRLVLAGSMELEEAFASPDLQAFSQRLAARCYLEPFDRAETLDYLRFQVAVAGGQAERVFDAGAMDAVHRATDGIPRLINQLCDHALLLAYQAERRPLDAKAIDVAWADLQQLPSPWQHERATDADMAANRETVEFGALQDDDPTTAPAASWHGADAIPAGTGHWPSEPSAERVEVDFSADWPDEGALREDPGSRPAIHIPRVQRHATPPRAAPPSPKPKGLRIVEDVEKLQVVVDPYQGLDEDDEAAEGDEATAAGPEADESRPAAAAARVRGHETADVWEDVIIPSPPGNWANAPAATQRVALGPAARPSPAQAAAAHRVAVEHDVQRPGAAESLEEEIVADRYAELDARRPRPADTLTRPSGVRKAPPAKDASRKGPRRDEFSAPAPRTDEVTADDLGLDERVTLAEAMRLRLEAEAAAAMARVLSESGAEPPHESFRLAIDQAPPLPSTEDWVSDSETMALDPTQMPSGASGPDLNSDIIVIDDEPPAAPSASEPVHRVERKDYKTLLAQLRNG